MKFQVGTVSVELIDADDRICMSVQKGKPFEPRSLAIWANLCSQGGTVLDVGCYSGLFAIAAAKYGCDVHAFEPMPANVARIRANRELNGVGFWITEGAATDFNGETDIIYRPGVVGNTSGASLVRAEGDRLTIQAVTIDRLKLKNVTAMKIDVERGEPAVLRGAWRTIARWKPAILIEVLNDRLKDEVRSLLPGYEVVEEIDERNWLMVAQ